MGLHCAGYELRGIVEKLARFHLGEHVCPSRRSFPIHHSHAVAHSIRLLHVVRGEKNGGVESAPQIEEVFPNILRATGIESAVGSSSMSTWDGGAWLVPPPTSGSLPAGEGTYQRIRVPFQVEK